MHWLEYVFCRGFLSFFEVFPRFSVFLLLYPVLLTQSSYQPRGKDIAKGGLGSAHDPPPPFLFTAPFTEIFLLIINETRRVIYMIWSLTHMSSFFVAPSKLTDQPKKVNFLQNPAVPLL